MFPQSKYVSKKLPMNWTCPHVISPRFSPMSSQSSNVSHQGPHRVGVSQIFPLSSWSDLGIYHLPSKHEVFKKNVAFPRIYHQNMLVQGAKSRKIGQIWIQHENLWIPWEYIMDIPSHFHITTTLAISHYYAKSLVLRHGNQWVKLSIAMSNQMVDLPGKEETLTFMIWSSGRKAMPHALKSHSLTSYCPILIPWALRTRPKSALSTKVIEMPRDWSGWAQLWDDENLPVFEGSQWYRIYEYIYMYMIYVYVY